MTGQFGLTAALLALVPAWAAQARGEDWTQFRGRMGVATAKVGPTEWDSAKNVAWKIKVPGYGWSSPIVSGGKVFITTAVAANQKAPLRKGPGSGEPAPP